LGFQPDALESTMPARKPPRRLVPLNTAADAYGIHHQTMRRWIREGRITGYRFGPKLLKIDLDELDAAITPVPVGR
jgi:excisionase family DNA binding protein